MAPSNRQQMAARRWWTEFAIIGLGFVLLFASLLMLYIAAQGGAL